MSHYIRTLITGTLTTQSNLHIGSGEETTLDGSEGSANVIVRSHNGKPYIPASSLRGFLRAQITDPILRQALFGLARQRARSDETGNVGQLRLYDAQLQGKEKEAQHISRTSIDPVTQTAKAHHLSTHEIIPPESCFELKLELDNSTETEIKALLQALATFNHGNPKGQIGKGKSIGQGQLIWIMSEITGLTKEKFKKWLTPPIQEKNKKYKKNKANNNNTGNNNVRFGDDSNFVQKYFVPLNITYEPAAHSWKTIEFTLQANSPILINDSQKQKSQEQSQKEKETTLAAVYMTRQGQACIPGSTLKGWLRSHCRRILLTLQQSENEENIETLLSQLFGSTETGQGILKFQDALTDIDEEKHTHPQTFIAIDRFTGGAKSGALYSVEAIWPDDFSGSFHYQAEKLQSWMKLLLLYALRDAMEGDLVLGWGKSRGYGQLTLKLKDIDLEKYSEDALDIWQKSLQKKVIA